MTPSNQHSSIVSDFTIIALNIGTTVILSSWWCYCSLFHPLFKTKLFENLVENLALTFISFILGLYLIETDGWLKKAQYRD